MEVQARRFVLLFKEQLPGEYERAVTVMERYRQRALSAAEATSELRALLSSSGEAGGAFDALLGGPRSAGEPADRGLLRGFVERVFPLLQAELPEAVALLRQNRERLGWDEKSFRSEAEFVAEVLASLGALGFEGVAAAERLLGRRADPPPSRPTKPAAPRGARAEEAPAAPVVEPEPAAPEAPPAEPAAELSAAERLFADLQARLAPAELEAFAHLFELFWRNVISFAEFRELAEELGTRAGKEACAALKAAVDQRENQRLALNPFNIRSCLADVGGPLNPSYRRVSSEVPHCETTAPLVNKAFTAIATGTENNANPNDSRGFAKYSSEVSLLNTEDQIYEFDSTLAQLRFAAAALAPLASGAPSPAQRARALSKVANTGVLATLFGGLAAELLAGAQSDPKVVEFLDAQVRAKLRALEEAKAAHFVPAWHAAINQHYFKALDTRSNAIKHFERKQINPRVLLNELRAPPALERVRVANSFEFLMSRPPRELRAPAALRAGKLFAPLMALEVAPGRALADAAAFVKAFVWFKGVANEKDRALLMLERLAEQFLNGGTPRPDLAPLAAPAPLLEQAAELERRLYPQKPFYFGPRVAVELNAGKLAELDAKLRDLGAIRAKRAEPGQAGNLNDQFDAVLQSNSSDARLAETAVAPRAPAAGAKLFFGQQNFYLSFRYLLMVYDRFAFAQRYSEETTGGEALYELFKKAFLFSLFDVIDGQAFEDLMRILFDLSAGPFLSLDKLFAAFAKNTGDDLTGFVLQLNAEMFEGRAEGLPAEEVLFAKTCFRQSELISQAHKSTKAAANSQHPKDSEVPELLKFELLPDLGVLLVHRLKSPFSGGANTVGKFLEDHFAVLSFGAPSPAPPKKGKAKPEARSKKIAHQCIRSIFASKSQKTMSTTVDTEDRILSIGGSSKAELEKRKEQKKRFVQIFRDKLTKSESSSK